MNGSITFPVTIVLSLEPTKTIAKIKREIAQLKPIQSWRN
jgi:ribosomal protein L29